MGGCAMVGEDGGIGTWGPGGNAVRGCFRRVGGDRNGDERSGRNANSSSLILNSLFLRLARSLL